MNNNTGVQKPQTEFKRTDNFLSVYANNFQLESTAIDMKFIFGTTSQSPGKVTVEQHTSVNMTWVQAKLLSFYLNVNLAAHEMENGKISIPHSVIPAEPQPIPKEFKDQPFHKQVRAMVVKMREEFIANL
ncbi:hypothetical protein D4S03_05390 [bacterium]|nr:MAG: hypothetical protein D4S03_05390 [bacterium]